MTIVDFCQTEYGIGINQARLYRKLKRYIEQNGKQESSKSTMEYVYGFKVTKDEKGRLCYDIWSMKKFYVLARDLAARPMEVTSSELDMLIDSAGMFRDAYYGKHPDLMLTVRDAAVAPLESYRDWIKRLDEVLAPFFVIKKE